MLEVSGKELFAILVSKKLMKQEDYLSLVVLRWMKLHEGISKQFVLNWIFFQLQGKFVFWLELQQLIN